MRLAAVIFSDFLPLPVAGVAAAFEYGRGTFRTMISSVVSLFFLMIPISALACIPGGPAPDELLPLIQRSDVDVAFVGSVQSVDGGKVVFKVAKGFKNIKDGATYSGMPSETLMQCMDLQVGQVWFYFHVP